MHTDQPTCIVCIVCSTLLPAHMHVSFATGGRERERGSQRELSQRELSQREDTDTDTYRERERPGQIIKMHPIPSTWKMNSGPATWRAPTPCHLPTHGGTVHRAFLPWVALDKVAPTFGALAPSPAFALALAPAPAPAPAHSTLTLAPKKKRKPEANRKK